MASQSKLQESRLRAADPAPDGQPDSTSPGIAAGQPGPSAAAAEERIRGAAVRDPQVRAEAAPASDSERSGEGTSPADDARPARARARGRRRTSFPIVGIGASAGGVEAFKRFFEAMPAESGMAFIVILHLSPEHSSMLPDLLQRHTRMEVHEARSRLRIEPNHVYVIPPGKYLTVRKRTIYLDDPAEADRPRAPVDALFRSLAADQQERVIAVILSGTGSNGTLGLKEIKGHGGLAIAQDPETAAHPGMAQSAINAGLVDLVLPIPEMPEALAGYARHGYVEGPRKPPAPESDMQAMLRLVRSRTGRDFSHYKAGTLQRRIGRRMSVRNAENVHNYVELLRQDPDEAQALSNDLLIKVTSFFRDPQVFEELAATAIPDIVQQSERTGGIRVWVPACATGEEAYTIAMLILERLALERRTAAVKVFASDVDHDAVEFARAGCYPEAIADDVPEPYLRRYFTAGDHGYQVTKPVRDSVVFALQDVCADPPFSRMDLVSCRNLLIYLQPEPQRRLLGLFHFGLREGGWLFLGTAETTGDHSEMFEPVSKKSRIYRRIGPTRQDRLEFPAPTWEPAHHELARVGAAVEPHQPRSSLWVRQLLLERYAPACVLIDRAHQILYFSGSTHEYLVQPIGQPTHDLLTMAREGLGDKLRFVVNRAIEEERPVIATAEVRRGAEFAPVRCMAIPLKAPREAEGLLLVSFEDQLRRPPGAPPAGDDDSDEPRLQQLEYELALTREDLQAVIERLESSNEEYKAANEEVRSMNEELQSVNEELETSKEELQSLNEELTSVNNQLEAKVSELEQATDDLSSLLRSTDIATIFLDRALRIKRFTPAVRSLLNLISGDVGRPMSDIARKFSDETLMADVQAVLDHLVPREAEVSTPDVKWYLRRVLPYRTDDDRIDGVVITFTEITLRKRVEQELSALTRSLERKVDQRTRCVRLLQDVAVIANQAQSVPDAIRDTLQRVCTVIGWSAGHAFLLDEDDEETLVDTGLWHLPASDALTSLVEATRHMRYRRGEGLPGRVVESGRPVVVRDIKSDPTFLRAQSLNGGIRTAYAFPVLTRAQVAGVLEFFTVENAEPDPELVESLREIGTQLGRVIERKQLQREVAEATAHEQRFVGQELHDTISQDIAGVAMFIGRLEQELQAAASPLASQAAALAQHLDTARQHVRQLAHGLMPIEIESTGLLSALTTLAATTRELHGIDCTVHCDGICELESSTVAMHLYRIAQEALQNALRHGKASRVEMRLSTESGTATLIIHDNGGGFDPQTQQPGGIGMQIMRYRAGLVGAKLDVRARPGEGTEVVCTFPCSDA